MKRKRPFLSRLLCLIFILSFCLTGCAAKAPVTGNFLAMDTLFSYSLYGESTKEAIKEIQKKSAELEKIFSNTSDSGLPAKVFDLTPEKELILEEEEALLLSEALSFSAESGGVFDVTVGNLKTLWNTAEKNDKLPDQSEIDLAKKRCGFGFLQQKDRTLSVLESGILLDFGGIAKGYAADCLQKLMVEHRLSGFISLGGCIASVGKKPDGSSFVFGLQIPRTGVSGYFATLKMPFDGVLSTSGNYERFYEIDGKKYSQILDPFTGRPTESEFLSVTVLSEDGTESDALSTWMMLCSEEEAVSLAKEYEVLVILVTNENKLLVSKELEPYFSLQPGLGYELSFV